VRAPLHAVHVLCAVRHAHFPGAPLPDTPYVMRTVAARMADDVAGATAAVHALQEVDNQAWTKKLAPEDDGFDASDADAALCAAEERLLDERTLLHRHDSLAEIVEGVGEVPAVVVAAIEKLAWARSRVATAALHGAVAECEAAGKAAAEWHRAKSVLAQLQVRYRSCRAIPAGGLTPCLLPAPHRRTWQQ